MTARDYKHLFAKSLAAQGDYLHVSAHSHHLWPDCSEAAQAQYWCDSAALSDRKWGKIFAEIIPGVQSHIARTLNLPDPATIAFAPNTHEFVMRLISGLPERPRILTTDSEFHSFDRQIRRLEEDGLAQVTRINTDPLKTFPKRMREAASGAYDMVFFSHVFFNSAFAVPDLREIVAAVPDEKTLIVIDGYHGFMALPTNLSALHDRAFYIAGGYKYAMSGEGCCFMHCPAGYAPRPRDTGWFADMGALESAQSGIVPYATDGFRFWGATFDPSGLYRMRAVMDMLARENITVADIHAHVIALQDYFLEHLAKKPGRLITPVNTPQRGHFLTFDTPDAATLCQSLAQTKILTDHRTTRLRFGFGIYQDKGDVDELVRRLGWRNNSTNAKQCQKS